MSCEWPRQVYAYISMGLGHSQLAHRRVTKKTASQCLASPHLSCWNSWVWFWPFFGTINSWIGAYPNRLAGLILQIWVCTASMKYCLTSLKLRANIVVNLDPNLIQDDLRERTDFLRRWQIEGPPDTYWLTALFEPGVSVTYIWLFLFLINTVARKVEFFLLEFLGVV